MARNYQGGNDAVITGAFAPMMKTLQQNYQYEQQRRQDELKQRDLILKDINKDLSKVNSNGIRQADLPEFTQAYGDLKETYYKLLNAQTPSERGQLSMEINERLGGINSLVAQSKQYGDLYSKSIGGLGSMVGKGRFEEAKNHITALNSKPSSQLTREDFDTSGYLYTYDPTKIDRAVSRVADTLLKSTTEQRSTPISFSTTGGKRYNEFTFTKSAPEEKVLEEISRLARGGDRDVQNYVTELMGTEQIDFNTAVAQVATEFNSKFNTSRNQTLSADKSSITVNVNNVPERVEESLRPFREGIINDPQAVTYNNDFTLQGGVIYDINSGEVIPAGRSAIDIEGTTLITSPVDSQGRPVAQGSPEAVGAAQFVAGQAQDPTRSRVRKEDTRRTPVLIPYRSQNFLNMSKRAEEGVIGFRNSQQTQTENTNPPKQETVAESMRRLSQQK